MTRSSRPPPDAPDGSPDAGRPRGPRRTRQILGRLGESEAARFLEARGYRIVARNVRADRVEIDLVARRGTLLAFVEVKSRRSRRHGSPAEAVDERKQSRLRRGASAWLATRPPAARGTSRVRFDVVTCQEITGQADGAPAGSESSPSVEVTARDGTCWWIEHWEAAF